MYRFKHIKQAFKKKIPFCSLVALKIKIKKTWVDVKIQKKNSGVFQGKYGVVSELKMARNIIRFKNDGGKEAENYGGNLRMKKKLRGCIE